MKVRLTVAAALAVLIIGMLSACGDGSPQITDAKSLAAANKTAQEAVENYHMDMNMNMDVTMNLPGLEDMLGSSSIEVPTSMEMRMDSGKETAHANSSMSMTMMGQSMDQDAEMYIDITNGTAYTKAAGTDTWQKSENSIGMTDMTNSLSELGDDIMSEAVFSETEEDYTLTLDAAVLGEAIKEMDLLGSLDAAGMGLEDFSIDGGQLTYIFDKESVLIKKIEMNDVDVKASGDISGSTADMEMPINATFDFSKYNELSAADYEIPADVKQ